MDAPPEDVLAALAGEELEEAEAPPFDAGRALVALAPVRDELHRLLPQLELYPVRKLSPHERTELVALRNLLAQVRTAVSLYVDTIDISFRRAAAELEAKAILLEDGQVTVEPPRAEWQVDGEILRTELRRLIDRGLITQDDIDRALPVVVETKADNRVLNYLASNRGAEVRELIEAHRRQVPGDPTRAKVTYQRRAE